MADRRLTSAALFPRVEHPGGEERRRQRSDRARGRALERARRTLGPPGTATLAGVGVGDDAAPRCSCDGGGGEKLSVQREPTIARVKHRQPEPIGAHRAGYTRPGSGRGHRPGQQRSTFDCATRSTGGFRFDETRFDETRIDETRFDVTRIDETRFDGRGPPTRNRRPRQRPESIDGRTSRRGADDPRGRQRRGSVVRDGRQPHNLGQVASTSGGRARPLDVEPRTRPTGVEARPRTGGARERYLPPASAGAIESRGGVERGAEPAFPRAPEPGARRGLGRVGARGTGGRSEGVPRRVPHVRGPTRIPQPGVQGPARIPRHGVRGATRIPRHEVGGPRAPGRAGGRRATDSSGTGACGTIAFTRVGACRRTDSARADARRTDGCRTGSDRLLRCGDRSQQRSVGLRGTGARAAHLGGAHPTRRCAGERRTGRRARGAGVGPGGRGLHDRRRDGAGARRRATSGGGRALGDPRAHVPMDGARGGGLGRICLARGSGGDECRRLHEHRPKASLGPTSERV